MTTDKIYKKKWAVNLIESERGWGSRVDETRHFDSKKEAEDFVERFNSANKGPAVPSWYMYAEEPREEFVEAKER